MKKKYLLVIVCCLLFISGYAQPGADTMPYRKYPAVPAFRILMLDSSTIFNTYDIKEGHPILFMFFGADCDHCEKLTEAITEHMDSLKHVQICLLTLSPMASTRAFYQKLDLKRFKNIMVGKDMDFFFPKFYKAYYVPFLAIYDRKKQLVRVFVGGGKISDIIKAVQ